MFKNAPIMATLVTTNVERAKRFYSEKLNLELKEELGESDGERGLLYEAGNGTQIYIYESPTPSASDSTAAVFMVDDVESIVPKLREELTSKNMTSLD